MNARDELFDIVRSVIDGELGILVNGSDIDNTADSLSYAILAAGYSKPRTITTREEVAALPEGSVILDSAGDVARLRHGLWCSYETAAMTHNRMAKYTPATVLYAPKES